jgi:hypothetical protein
MQGANDGQSTDARIENTDVGEHCSVRLPAASAVQFTVADGLVVAAPIPGTSHVMHVRFVGHRLLFIPK